MVIRCWWGRRMLQNAWISAFEQPLKYQSNTTKELYRGIGTLATPRFTWRTARWKHHRPAWGGSGCGWCQPPLCFLLAVHDDGPNEILTCFLRQWFAYMVPWFFALCSAHLASVRWLCFDVHYWQHNKAQPKSRTENLARLNMYHRSTFVFPSGLFASLGWPWETIWTLATPRSV